MFYLGSVSSMLHSGLTCSTSLYTLHSVSTKVHTQTPADKTKYPLGDSAQIIWRLGGYTRGCARAHPLTKQNFPRWQHENPPRQFYPNHVGARGLHPRVRSRAPTVKTKILQTILPESPRGSGAPVGFINPGSLGDRLPNKGSAQRTNVARKRANHGPAQVPER